MVLPGEDLLARLCSSQGSPDLQRGALGEGHSKALSYTHTAGPAPELASLLWKGIRLYSFIKTLVQPGPSNLGLDLVICCICFSISVWLAWHLSDCPSSQQVVPLVLCRLTALHHRLCLVCAAPAPSPRLLCSESFCSLQADPKNEVISKITAL